MIIRKATKKVVMKEVAQPDRSAGLWLYLTKKYKTEVVKKADAKEMKVIGEFLDAVGVLDDKDFMDRFSTTLGNRIYLCNNYEALSELDKIGTCVHEHVHVRQWRMNPVLSPLQYAADRARRTAFECEAYRANMEMTFFLTGKCPDPKKVADLLKSYNVNKDDLKFAQAYLSKAADIVKRGGVVTRESKTAIGYLKIANTRGQ